VEPRVEAVLALVDELDRRDADIAARVEVVAQLLQRVDTLRARATLVRARLGEIPGEQEAALAAEAEAGRREEEARAELAETERRAEEVARSRRAGEETEAQAAREVGRAREALIDAGTRRNRAEARRAALVDEEDALGTEAGGLAVTAEGIATEIQKLPRVSDSGRSAPGSSLTDLEDWGARAHAALFVVRGGLEAERERTVVEAASLGASVLGEHFAGSSIALIRRRLEQSLSRS
jgi:vacuolar-type H+-ATPase subunit I/STV1